jgi:hypothetical protein
MDEKAKEKKFKKATSKCLAINTMVARLLAAK